MTCYHPLKGFIIGTKNNGKKDIIITPYEVNHIELVSSGSYEKSVQEQCSDRCQVAYREYIQIPCNSCVGCKLDYSKQWADRCELEMREHKNNYFITLTYDEKHLPKNINGLNTLSKRDVQLFIKLLRRHYNKKLSYFLCGEYGPNTLRPHYHAIIFGLDLEDLEFYTKSDTGYEIYNSKFLTDLWNKGYVTVQKANYETAAYTARYVTKKVDNNYSSQLEELKLENEFLLMSKRPGIGKKYFEKNKLDIVENGKIIVRSNGKGNAINIPRYYKKLIEKDNIENYDIINKRYKDIGELNKMNLLIQKPKSYLKRLADKELLKKSSVKKLVRKEL